MDGCFPINSRSGGVGNGKREILMASFLGEESFHALTGGGRCTPWGDPLSLPYSPGAIQAMETLSSRFLVAHNGSFAILGTELLADVDKLWEVMSLASNGLFLKAHPPPSSSTGELERWAGWSL